MLLPSASDRRRQAPGASLTFLSGNRGIIFLNSVCSQKIMRQQSESCLNSIRKVIRNCPKNGPPNAPSIREQRRKKDKPGQLVENVLKNAS